ncbi:MULTISPECIES: hypothetical protein [Cryobacterium]|uniref:Tfp pilus assembly protein PilO n=1 Tax=Cryobacterium breve TaxID=1259258 RepID=A0ABY2J0J0_9MICO|nr:MULTISPECIES: hypothetical protein [Cryobacterium]TFC91824.1 hypothetical protein E3T20_13315 [Cryobacterium sp. TmT3-12]TFC98375.1 hypothetical protein E3O65_08535 [Cryobacterium breve]
MNKNRLWTISSVLVMVLVLMLGVLLGIQPQLAATSAANDQRISVQASNAGQAAVLVQLKEDFAGIDKLKADLAPLSDSVPNGTDIPAFVNQLDALASASQVTLTGITVADAVPYAPVVAPVEAATETTQDATPEPTTSAAPAPTAGVPPVTNPQITVDNFASLAVSITVSGSYANALNFVSGLQTGSRLFLVSGISTSKEAESVDVTATITGLVYVLVPPASAAPATTAAQ